MTDGGWLSSKKKLQLKVIFYGLLLGAVTYTVIGLLNGFEYVNYLAAQHPLPLTIYLSFLIAAIPFYRRNDKSVKQIVYQIGWSGTVLLIPAISAFLYYNFNPPTTGIGRITLATSKILVWTTGAIIIGNLIFAKRKYSTN